MSTEREMKSDDAAAADKRPSPEEPNLTQYDKELADSFPASDPPSMP